MIKMRIEGPPDEIAALRRRLDPFVDVVQTRAIGRRGQAQRMTITPKHLPHAIAGSQATTLHRLIFDIYRRECRSLADLTAAHLNMAIDWWNGAR